MTKNSNQGGPALDAREVMGSEENVLVDVEIHICAVQNLSSQGYTRAADRGGSPQAS